MTGTKQTARIGLEGLVGADVEVRIGNGSPIRGELVGVDREFLHVERRSTGRVALVNRSSVQTVIDERAPLLRPSAGSTTEDL